MGTVEVIAVLMAAIGVDGNGDKHVLAVVEGATENTVVVQALIDNLLARGLDPTLPRLFIVDGAKALSKAIRNTFGVAAAIQRCQVHKGRNIIERLPQHLHASVKKALRQAWDQDDANKAERLLRNLVRRLEHEEPGVSGSILEGLEEILTVIRLGLPHELRRSLACTNIVENALGTVRQVMEGLRVREVHECLVDGERLHQGCQAQHHRADLAAHGCVLLHVGFDDGGVGTGLQGLEHWHGRADTVGAGDVAAGGDHATVATADDHRDITQLRPVSFLDGSVEGVAVEMGDREIMEFLVSCNPHRAAGRASLGVKVRPAAAVAAQGFHGTIIGPVSAGVKISARSRTL